MRAPTLLAIAFLGVYCAPGRADACAGPDDMSVNDLSLAQVASPGDQVAERLIDVAKGKNEPLLVRTNALDILAKLSKAKRAPSLKKDAAAMPAGPASVNPDPGAAKPDPAILAALTDFLKKPPVKDYEKDFFLLHVVEVLGAIGPDARDALPELARIRSTDYTLRNAIADAEQSITQPPPAAKTPASPDVTKLLSDLANETQDPAKRLAAAKALSNPPAGSDSSPIIAGLLKAMQDPDSDVAIVAAESAHHMIISSNAKQGSNSTTQFVIALIKMFSSPYAVVRIAAAGNLGAIGPDAANALCPLRHLAKHDCNADVRCVAKNAERMITQALSTCCHD
jgi:hypothetical protein